MATEPSSSGSMAVVVIVALLVIALVAFGAFTLLGNQDDGASDGGGIDIGITVPAPTEGSSLQWDMIEAGDLI